MALIGSTNAEKIWNYLVRNGVSKYGAAGLMGNLDCESALNPKNLEDAYESKLGFTNDSYVAAVDSGTYQNFVRDSAGFGLAQWTWWTRKQALLNFAKASGRSIGDLEMQLDFLVDELKRSFPAVWNVLVNATSVYAASNAVLLNFEQPLNQSLSVQNTRANYGQKYYDRFANGAIVNNEVSATMGYYKIQKGTKVSLSKSFISYEFDCHGSGCCSVTLINEKLVDILQQIRDYFNSPITITSAYRCVNHNRSIGGATASKHMSGDAADIVVAGHTPAEVAKYAESIGVKGIGLYETDFDGHFVHVDTRDNKSFWYGQKQAPRTTFGGATITLTSYGNSPVIEQQKANGLIVYGSAGEDVKELQEKLITLGYSCGVCGADGCFGLATLNAVKAFQKDAGFAKNEQDGVVGGKTRAAIDSALSDKKGTVTVTASVLNVRSGPGTNYGIVATVARGSTLIIDEESNGWGRFATGWVSMQYVQRKG